MEVNGNTRPKVENLKLSMEIMLYLACVLSPQKKQSVATLEQLMWHEDVAWVVVTAVFKRSMKAEQLLLRTIWLINLPL